MGSVDVPAQNTARSQPTDPLEGDDPSKVYPAYRKGPYTPSESAHSGYGRSGHYRFP